MGGNAHHNAFTSGLQVGYLYQMGHFVYGTELGIVAGGFKNTYTLKDYDVGQFINIFKPGDSFSSESNWQASWVARLGPAWDNWLFYGLGGLALRDSKLSTSIRSIEIDGELFPASQGHEKKALVGGTVGLGAEYALQSNIRVGVE